MQNLCSYYNVIQKNYSPKIHTLTWPSVQFHGRIRGQEIGLFPLKKSLVDLRGQWDQNFWLRGLESPLKQPYQLEETPKWPSEVWEFVGYLRKNNRMAYKKFDTWTINSRRKIWMGTRCDSTLPPALPSFIQLTVIALTFCDRSIYHNILCAPFHFQQY